MTDQDFARLTMVAEVLTALGLTDVLDDLANGDEDIAELALARLCDEAPPCLERTP